jgi:hypothetical protein
LTGIIVESPVAFGPLSVSKSRVARNRVAAAIINKTSTAPERRRNRSLTSAAPAAGQSARGSVNSRNMTAPISVIAATNSAHRTDDEKPLSPPDWIGAFAPVATTVFRSIVSRAPTAATAGVESAITTKAKRPDVPWASAAAVRQATE